MREQSRTAHDGKADIEMALINTGVKISRIDQNVVTFQEVDRFLVKGLPGICELLLSLIGIEKLKSHFIFDAFDRFT